MTDEKHPVLVGRDPDGDGRLIINTRTIVIVLVALLGGAGSSVGVSIARPTVPDAMVADIAAAKTSAEEAKTSTKNVEATLADVRLTLVRIQGSLEAAAGNNAATEHVLSDHEQRLRILEKRAR